MILQSYVKERFNKLLNINSIKKRIMQTEKKEWITYLRVIGTFCVVIVHIISSMLHEFDSSTRINWWTGNIIDGSLRYCLAVFVMLTGALLLPQNIDIGTFLKKRLKRVIIPFIVWSIIYIVYAFFSKDIGDTLLDYVKYFFSRLLTGASYHLWYIYMLIGLYLFIPILGKWIRNSTEREIIYFLIIWFISMFTSKMLYFNQINPIYFTGYIGYLVLGYYLSIKEFKNTKRLKKIALLLFILGTFITIFGTYFLSKLSGKFNDILYNHLTPNLLISSIGIFILIKYSRGIKSSAFSKIISNIDKYSYGIYLSHILVLNILGQINITAYSIMPAIGIPLTFLCCCIILFLIFFGLSKTPFGKFIT